MKKTMTASEILSDLGSHKFEILRRDANGAGELHQNWTDVFVVQGGEATIVYGGKIQEARDTGNGEIRGPNVVGGKSQRVVTGDGPGNAAWSAASDIGRARQVIFHAHRQGTEEIVAASFYRRLPG